MGEKNDAQLNEALTAHFAASRETASPEAIDRLVRQMVAEDARARRSEWHHAGIASFVAAQVRYVPAWTWAAQTALIALMCLVAHSSDSWATPAPARIAIGILSTLTVLVGVPTMDASKRHGVAELEYACAHNTASVLVARLIVLGCSSALAVALMVAATAATLDVSAFDMALWACPPFFLSCAGSLAVLRKASPSMATTLSTIWVLACNAVLLALAASMPDAYAHTSLATWAAAALCALAWLVREATLTVRAAAAGLDAFSPYLARTNS